MAPKSEFEATEPFRKQPQPFAPPPRPPRRSSSRTQKTRQDSPVARRRSLQEAAWNDTKAALEKEDELRSARAIFALFDADEDGVLGQDEYKAYLKGIGAWGTRHYTDKKWDDRWPVECQGMNCTVAGITKKNFEELLYGKFRSGLARSDLYMAKKGIKVRNDDGKLLLTLEPPKTGQEIIDELVKANVFPKQKYQSQWSRFEERSFDPSIYTDIEALIEFSEYAQVKWVKAGYLLQLARSGTRLLRSQDVPASDVCTQEDLRSWALLRPLLVISHPWHAQHHPDPTGQSLLQICIFIRKYYGDLGEDILKSCPCFIDFTALAQNSLQKPRSKDENDFFERAILNLNIFYRHEETFVLRLSGPVPDDSSVKNSTPYHERGWCVCEHRISEMKTDPSRSKAYHEFTAGKKSAIEFEKEPMSPERFEKELRGLRFTAGEVDKKKVADMYEQTYKAEENKKKQKRMAEEHLLESMDPIAPKITLVVGDSILEPDKVLNEKTKVFAITGPWSPSELRQEQARLFNRFVRVVPRYQWCGDAKTRANSEGAAGFVGSTTAGAAAGFMFAGPPGAVGGAVIGAGTKALTDCSTYTWHSAKFQLGLTEVLPRCMGGATGDMVFEWRTAECKALRKAKSYKWSGILVGSSYPKASRSSSVPVLPSAEQKLPASPADEQMTMILEQAGIIKMTNEFADFNVVSDYVFGVETYKNLSIQFWTADGVEHDSIHCMNARTHYRRYSAKTKAGAKITRVIATLL